MVFFAEISSLDFPKNVVYTKYLKLLTILIEYLPAIFWFSCYSHQSISDYSWEVYIVHSGVFAG